MEQLQYLYEMYSLSYNDFDDLHVCSWDIF